MGSSGDVLPGRQHSAPASDINVMAVVRVLLLKQLLQMCWAMGQDIVWLSLGEELCAEEALTSAMLWQALAVLHALPSSAAALWHQGHADCLAVFGSAQCCCV